MNAWKRLMAPGFSGQSVGRASQAAFGLVLRACMALLLAACAQERPSVKGLLQVSAQPVAQVAATSGEQAALAGLEAAGDGKNTWSSATNLPLELGLDIARNGYTLRDTLGMNGRPTPTSSPVTLSAVPLHALARCTGSFQFTVHVVAEKDGRAYAQARTVTVAQVAGDMVTILSGVRPGELVITSGTTLATDGQEIRYTRS
ncbi:hypothetical protein [Fundidesulfovibrio terrae]|uniref:hypothetical protein n=1 Tax=Fundidesulfovibrio terrae TaxID=2922866 RepID=UPI001FAEDAA3|nr:hypothetical protein [Fundidesulfovibrio terrae]